ncbi:hypothetical protein ABPG74_016165 [Tetrahymena malaccensis]
MQEILSSRNKTQAYLFTQFWLLKKIQSRETSRHSFCEVLMHSQHCLCIILICSIQLKTHQITTYNHKFEFQVNQKLFKQNKPTIQFLFNLQLKYGIQQGSSLYLQLELFKSTQIQQISKYIITFLTKPIPINNNQQLINQFNQEYSLHLIYSYKQNKILQFTNRSNYVLKCHEQQLDSKTPNQHYQQKFNQLIYSSSLKLSIILASFHRKNVILLKKAKELNLFQKNFEKKVETPSESTNCKFLSHKQLREYVIFNRIN